MPVAIALTASLLLGLAVPGTTATGSTTLALQITGPSWTAWRFNLTPGSDLVIRESFNGCDPQDSYGQAHVFVSIHNATSVNAYWSADSSGVLNPQLVAGAQGKEIRQRVDLTAAGFGDGYCGGTVGWGARAAPNDTTLTIVLLESAPFAWFNATATWTQGVLSSDISSGVGQTKRLSEFDEGASVTAWEADAGATIGIGLQEKAQTVHLGLGWFIPIGGIAPDGVPGATLESCAQNGQPCSIPSDANGDRWLQSSGATDWEFKIPFKAQFGERPGEALGLFDLPCEYSPSTQCAP